jgi:glycosyltransferase involved in cell wall biosynthesis
MTISLIVPAYNEEVNIQKGVLDKIGNYTAHDPRFREIILVDDGSTDNTRKLIETKYLKEFPKFILLKNNHQGKAQALISGIRSAKSDAVMFTDIDLATPLEDSDKLIAELEKGYEIVIGSRNTHREGAPILRKIMAVGFIYVRNFLIGLKNVRDTQCGFKAFRRKEANAVLDKLRVFGSQKDIKGSSVKAGFDLEFLFLASKLGYKIREIPVTWRHVETKNVNFLKDTVETMKDILLIKYYDLTSKYH